MAFDELHAQAAREANRLRAALSQIEEACNLSPHRDLDTWDANLAKLIHHHARLLTAGVMVGDGGQQR